MTKQWPRLVVYSMAQPNARQTTRSRETPPHRPAELVDAITSEKPDLSQPFAFSESGRAEGNTEV